jgi:hypothetical protein
MGRNPATGEAIEIPAKTVVKMRVAKAAIAALCRAGSEGSRGAVFICSRWSKLVQIASRPPALE